MRDAMPDSSETLNILGLKDRPTYKR